MKYIFAFLTFITIGIPIKSQESQRFSTKVNEINIGFFNAFELNGIDELGIGYKRRFQSGAIRTSTGFNFWKFDYDDDDNQWNRNGIEISPKIGYEFDHYINRICLQYGLDIVTSFSNAQTEHNAISINQNTVNRTTGYSIGLRPILGITVYLNKSISLSTETYFDILYTNSKEEQSSPTSQTSGTDKGISTGLGPLGIFSINFHF